MLYFEIHVIQPDLVHGIQDLAKIFADRNTVFCFCAFPKVTKKFGIEQRCPDNLVVCVERIERCVRKDVFFIIQMAV